MIEYLTKLHINGLPLCLRLITLDTQAIIIEYDLKIFFYDSINYLR
jgi:hypothetical protein